MDLRPVIARLQAQLAGQGFVAISGSGNLDAVLDTLANTPAVYVQPLAETPDEPDLASSAHQRIAQTFAVVLVVSNLQDATGAASAAELHTRRLAVRAALLGWAPDPTNGEPVVFIGGRILKFENQRLWWTDEFRVMTNYWSA